MNRRIISSFYQRVMSILNGNLKTINGNSIVGTGNVTIGGTANWGSIGGTLSSQTDLQTALNGKENSIVAGTTSQYFRGDKTFQTLDKNAVGLSNVVNLDTSNPANIVQSSSYRFVTDTEKTTWNGKQDLLVSGTNIVSINSNTLLNSGDLTIDKTFVGLGNVDNTSDINKPVSTLQASAIALKQDTLVSGTNIKTIEGQSLLGSGNIDLTKNDVGLGNVDNTSDLNKPISNATQTALNSKQDTLTLTTTGTSGAATLVGSTLNIPQYSGGGGVANPSVISLIATNGTIVTGTTNNTLSQSLLIPANTFTGNGMLEILTRAFKTGTAGSHSLRAYTNTSPSLTGAVLIATFMTPSTIVFPQGIRTFRINSNTLSGTFASTTGNDDYVNANGKSSTTFNTAVDNYIIFAIQLTTTTDSSVVEMSRAVKYV